MSDGPIFLVGAPRSGTTLMQYILRSHPDLGFPTGESHFFVPFYQQREAYGDLSRPENVRRLLEQIYTDRRAFFDEELHGLHWDLDAVTRLVTERGASTVPDIIATVMAENARLEGKSRWGDKTPYYVLHLALLQEMFPNARFVHIVRDGRDCALSMLERKKDLKIFSTYHAAYVWKRYVDAGTAYGERQPEAYKELNYEALIQDPEPVLTDLCRFLDVAYDPRLVDYTKARGPGKTPLVTKPIQGDNSEKWRSRMSRRQLEVFEGMAGDTLRAKGYAIATERQAIHPLADKAYSAHIRLSYLLQRVKNFLRRRHRTPKPDTAD